MLFQSGLNLFASYWFTLDLIFKIEAHQDHFLLVHNNKFYVDGSEVSGAGVVQYLIL
jgi:hypothetical protein